MRITSSSQVIRILHGLSSFQSPGAVPGDVPLEPTDTLLGVLGVGKAAAVVLLDCGAYLRVGDEWQLVPYGDIEVRIPARDAPAAPLELITPVGTAEILSGTSDVWEVGRFFTRCAEEAKSASSMHGLQMERVSRRD
jgi:hypothetical protein